MEKLIFIGLFYLGSALEETAQDRQCAGQHLVRRRTLSSLKARLASFFF